VREVEDAAHNAAARVEDHEEAAVVEAAAQASFLSCEAAPGTIVKVFCAFPPDTTITETHSA
jgi:hypothetical protein